jgi:hypothetical protein
MPPYLRTAHQLWQRRTPATEAQAERARILAEAMLRAGDPNDAVERQLLGLGIPPVTAIDVAKELTTRPPDAA